MRRNDFKKLLLFEFFVYKYKSIPFFTNLSYKTCFFLVLKYYSCKYLELCEREIDMIVIYLLLG